MAYLRTKWIKGYPYLYLQESYRENGKVKTRTVKYIGRGSSGGALSGVRNSQAAVDRQLAGLQQLQAYPLEAGILQGYLARHDAPLRIATPVESQVGDLSMSDTFYEYMLAGNTETQGEYVLRPLSSPFAWLHTVGHLMEDAGIVAIPRVAHEISAFTAGAEQRYTEAIHGSLTKIEAFIATYGDYIDMPQAFSVNETTNTTDTFLYDKTEIANAVEQLNQGALSPSPLLQKFQAWVVPTYHFNPREVFANALAALTIDAKYAADCFGKEGKTLLTVLYPVIHIAMEEFHYVISGRRPQNKTKRRNGRRHPRVRTASSRSRLPEQKVLFYVGDIHVNNNARQVLQRAENNQAQNALGTILYKHSTLAHYRSQATRDAYYLAMVKEGRPIQSTYLLKDGSLIWVSTFAGVTTVTVEDNAQQV